MSRAGGEAKENTILTFLALQTVLGRPLMLQHEVETRSPTRNEIEGGFDDEECILQKEIGK